MKGWVNLFAHIVDTMKRAAGKGHEQDKSAIPTVSNLKAMMTSTEAKAEHMGVEGTVDSIRADVQEYLRQDGRQVVAPQWP